MNSLFDENKKKDERERNNTNFSDVKLRINTLPERTNIDIEGRISPTWTYEKRLFLNKSHDMKAQKVKFCL